MHKHTEALHHVTSTAISARRDTGFFADAPRARIAAWFAPLGS